MATQPFSFDAMQQVYGQQQEPSGFAGLLSSPVGQGLLSAGLGALASRGTTAQAIGRGGLLGLSAYGQAQGQRENRLMQMAQAKLRDDALAKLSPGADGSINADPATLAAAEIPHAQWADIRNLGRDKIKQMQTVTGQDGSQQIYGVDEYGGIKSTGLTNAPELKTQDLGGQVVGMNPYTGTKAWSADKTLTPDQVQGAANQPFMVVNGQIVPNPAYQKFVMDKAHAGATRVSNNVAVNTEKNLLGTIADGVGKQVDASLGQARGAVSTLNTLDNLDAALKSGKILAGPATAPTQFLMQLGTQMGLGGKSAKETLENTRAAMQAMAQLELDAAAQMKGQGQITESERAILRKAASGDISMSLPEIETLSTVARRTANARIQQHNANVQPLLQNPNAAPLAPFLTVQQPQGQSPAGGGIIDFGSLK